MKMKYQFFTMIRMDFNTNFKITEIFLGSESTPIDFSPKGTMDAQGSTIN
jgi:hypothetical protein